MAIVLYFFSFSTMAASGRSRREAILSPGEVLHDQSIHLPVAHSGLNPRRFFL